MSRSYTAYVLLTFNAVFILFPPVAGKSYKYLPSFKLVSWVFLIFTAIVSPLTITVKDVVFHTVPTTSKVVYDLSIFFLYGANIYFAGLSIFKQSVLSKVLEDFLAETTDGYKFLYFVGFMSIHLTNITFILLTQFQRTHDIYYIMSAIFVDGFLTFRLITGLFMIFLIINHIKKRMEEFNENLSNGKGCSSIKHYRYLHNELCDYIDTVNKLFGVILLLIIFYFITTFLRHATFISLNYDKNLTSIVRCLGILSYGIQAAYLAHIGEQIETESKLTLAICYKLMPRTEFEAINVAINSELFLLAQQAFNRSTKISAAGFFNVDNSMILFIATTFFTYFIVVMQLLSARSA